MAESGDDSFNSSRAEVFEALGHPTRIRILQAVSERPLPFSELKHAVGLDSNGLLSFHLGRLSGLVKLNDEGLYTVTDEGKEALRIIDAGRKQDEGHPGARPILHLPHQKAILAGLLVALIVLGSVAVYQQEQILTLNHQLDSNTVVIGGTRYWYETATYPPVEDNGSTISFHSVTFTTMTPSFILSYSDPSQYTFYGSVRLSNGSLLNLTGKTVQVELSGGSVQIATNAPVKYTQVPQFGVAVSFPGGTNEIWDGFTVAAVNIPGDYNIPHPYVLLKVTFAQVVLNPWFTNHTGPQAGVLWNTTSGHLTFYVSVS